MLLELVQEPLLLELVQEPLLLELALERPVQVVLELERSPRVERVLGLEG